MTLLGSAPGMAFMMKKKKYKFEVDLNLEEMIEVPFLNAVLFAKIRLLEGGFHEISNRHEVQDHTVKWGQQFKFTCKMSANAMSGELDPCMLRISIRKEIKGGRSYQKLGYADFNLASYAGQGLKSKKTILKGYDTQHRQDNSMLLVTIKMHMLSGDILFKVPSPEGSKLPSEEGLDVPKMQPPSQPPPANLVAAPANAAKPASMVNSKDDASIASSISSSGCGSLTKKSKTQTISDYQPTTEADQQSSIITDSGISDVSETPQTSTIFDRSSAIVTVNSNTNLNAQSQQQQQQQNIGEMGHSRTSSNTSQMSKGSGYSSSISERQHSRQSSDGDTGHTSSRYTRGTFQKAESLSSWYESQSRDKMIHRRRESHSLKLKIVQHNKDLMSCKSPDSPTNEMYRTPNTTLEMDDEGSGFDVFCTPSADVSLMKMKSMNNLHDGALANGNANGSSLARMKSLGQLNGSRRVNGTEGGGGGDTPLGLVRLKRDFETTRFNDAKMQSMNNLHRNGHIDDDQNGFDVIDGFSSRRHHSDNDASCPKSQTMNDINRLSLQTPKRRVGITKYVGADSQEEHQNYQLMKMHSMCTITDIVNNNMRAYDGLWKGLGNGVNGKKYDKRFIVPIKLDEKYVGETNGSGNNNSNNDDVFKMPQAKTNAPTTMNPLRKEKSSSCIESMKNRSSTLYDRLRNSLHRRLLDGSPRMSTLNASSPPNESSQNISADVSLSASMNGDAFSTTLSPMPSGTSSLVLRRPSANTNPSSGSIQMSDTGSLDRMKAQAERRKKVYEDHPTITGRVENTRVNPDKTIDELLSTHKLEQLEEDTEPRGGGLKLVIGRDGKASIGSHETTTQQQRAFKHVIGLDNSR